MKKISFFLIMLSVYISFTSFLRGQDDVGIIFDISGSMRPENWIKLGKIQIINLLVEGQFDEMNWSYEPYKENKLSKLLSQNRPLISEISNLYLINMAKIEKGYPFFKEIYSSKIKNLQEASNFLNSYLPSPLPYEKIYSHVLLAQALASKHFKDNGLKEWYLIIFSDFIKDYAELTEQQNEMCLDYEAGKGLEKSILFNLVLKQNNKIRIRVDKIKVAPEPAQGEIYGRVIDEKGGALPSVSIEINNIETGRSLKEITNESGVFYARNLKSGRFKLIAYLRGYKTETKEVELASGQKVNIEFTLIHSEESGILELIGPPNGRKLREKKPTFIWRWTGKQQIENYVFTLLRKVGKKNKLTLKTSLKRTRYVTFKKLQPGNYSWYVKAKHSEGTIKSTTRTFKVTSDYFLTFLLIIFICAAIFMFVKFGWPFIQKRRGKLL